ncbi:MAG: hypothetical protein JOY71_12195 [Acetobacteraceae bacterium]|nr:hypothetical protein [Acetobacteraceae bacterium]MBV8522860.1 hypothetical protein [Acetobacteraceae bacterium]MBV8590177.1 hypothetical protein [Acetobacteraceae bacterium]
MQQQIKIEANLHRYDRKLRWLAAPECGDCAAVYFAFTSKPCRRRKRFTAGHTAVSSMSRSYG